MGNACVNITYAKWIADRQEALPKDRQLDLANTGLYVAWGSIALCRAGVFLESIRTFFTNPSPALMMTKFAAEGARHALFQVGIALSSTASIVEMVITSVVFGRHVDRHQRIGTQLTKNRATSKAFAEHTKDKREPVHNMEQSPTCAVVGVEKKPMSEQAASYLAYQTARIDRRESTNTVKHSSVMFARDGVMQGGGVGCNLALLWDAFKVSDLLHLAAAPINATATAIGGFAFSAACGALHIVAGALRWHDGLKKLAAVSGAMAAIERAEGRLREAKENQQADVQHAVGIAETLLTHARSNEKRATDDAGHQIRVGKWRIAYGSVAISVAGISLGLFLLVGGLSTGGILFGVVGGLALAGWTFYASYRNRNYAKSIEAALNNANNNVAASGEGAVERKRPLSLDEAIEQAVLLLDKTGNPDRDARRLIKETLTKMGLKPKYLWPLRFCATDPEVKGPVVEELKIKIRNLVDGDGARRAAVKFAMQSADGKAAVPANPVAVS
ncbi:hypothetical protein [Cupriavidus gilardii]|uniref:hypothetical protein n=1 Tax=Cupriavidus gilardii TaxID=82541 RepID=UPI000A823F97|nr:hypothetical protein [Cupriavidus gilardii]